MCITQFTFSVMMLKYYLHFQRKRKLYINCFFYHTNFSLVEICSGFLHSSETSIVIILLLECWSCNIFSLLNVFWDSFTHRDPLHFSGCLLWLELNNLKIITVNPWRSEKWKSRRNWTIYISVHIYPSISCFMLTVTLWETYKCGE